MKEIIWGKKNSSGKLERRREINHKIIVEEESRRTRAILG
jgi:hypothetical protein